MARSSSAAPRGSSPTRGSQRFLILAAILAGLVVLGTGGFLALTMREGPRGVAGSALAGAIGGPFQLTDQNGKTVTDADLKGKWSLVYFGYTHCPDACPTALNDIAVALSELGPKSDAVRPVFITVDPERDTPQSLKEYVTAFDAPILALTGTAEQVAKAAKEYRVYYAKHPEPGGDYSMDHSSVIYVMDPEGRFTASFTHESAPEQIAERLKKLIG
ncbi:MAG: SCO family protein [Stellaceae bacterium]